LNQVLQSYFAAEQNAMLWLFGIGLISLVSGLLLWRSQWSYRTAYWAMLLACMPQLGVSLFIYFRSVKQLEEYSLIAQLEPQMLMAQELERIIVVINRFTIYQSVEVVIFIGALVLSFIYRQRPAVMGITIGVCLQVSAMFIVDGSAEWRAENYRDGLIQAAQLIK